MSITNAEHRTLSARLKVERAKQNIRDLQGEIHTFLSGNPYSIGTKRNPDTGQLVYYVARTIETPAGLAPLCGDVLNNLRSALDHLAGNLVDANGGNTARRIYFPISDSAQAYPATKARCIQGISQEANDAIDALHPYRGGNDAFWKIQQLNNIDKHRMLITVGSAFHSVNLGAFFTESMGKDLAGRNDLPVEMRTIPAIDLYMRPADRLCPLKAGDELLIVSADSEPNEKIDFRFDVAFGEPNIAEGDPILETLQQMTDLVDNVVTVIKPLFA